MNAKSLLEAKVYDELFKGFSELRDVECSVAKVMRKYGESVEEKGMLYDEYGGHSTDDAVAIRIAGEEELSDYFEWLSHDRGGVEDVLEYLCDRFSCVDKDMRCEVRVYMLRWVLDEARRFEGEVGA